MKTRVLWMGALLFFVAVNVWAFATGDLEGLGAYLKSLGPWGTLATVDLLMALLVGVAWTWVDARSKGLSPWPWALLTVTTGSVGVLAYLARHGGPARPDVQRDDSGTLSVRSGRRLTMPSARVWLVLQDFQRVDRFHPWVTKVDAVTAQSCGVGTERVCHLEGMPSMKERVIAWDEGRGYTVEARTPIDFLGTMSGRLWLEPVDGTTTDVKFELRFAPRLGVLGRLVGGAFLSHIGERMGPHILAGLEHHLATGRKLGIDEAQPDPLLGVPSAA